MAEENKNYYLDADYSGIFKDMFGSVLSESLHYKPNSRKELTLAESKEMYKDIMDLKLRLDTSQIILETERKANMIIKILQNNLDLLEEKTSFDEALKDMSCF